MGSSFDVVGIARMLANGINPAFVILILGAPFVDRRWVRAEGVRVKVGWWLLASVIGIGVTVVLAESGKHFQVWPGHREFPSGHESFASAAAASLVARDRRWGWIAAPLALLMGSALVGAGYHQPIEVAGGMVLGAVVSGLIVGLTVRRVSASAPGKGTLPEIER